MPQGRRGENTPHRSMSDGAFVDSDVSHRTFILRKLVHAATNAATRFIRYLRSTAPRGPRGRPLPAAICAILFAWRGRIDGGRGRACGGAGGASEARTRAWAPGSPYPY